MQKKGLKPLGISLIVLFVIAIAIIGFVVFSNKSKTVATSNVVAGSSGTKLSDSPYANYAYLISTDTLSSDTQQAITGFQIAKVANPDGTTTYKLIAINPEYQNQTYTLQKGQSLYFIESSLGDDRNGSENFLGDDTAIVVDSKDYIVQ